MAGGLSAAAVLSPHELQRQQEQGTAVWTTGSGAESEDVESQQKESLPMRSTSSRSKAGTRLSPGYVRSGMWVALCLSLVALGGTVATTTYLMRERVRDACVSTSPSIHSPPKRTYRSTPIDPGQGARNLDAPGGRARQ